MTLPTKVQNAPIHGTPSFYFYNRVDKYETYANVSIASTGRDIDNVMIARINGVQDAVYVYMPSEMKNRWGVEDMPWNSFVDEVRREYCRQVLNEPVEPSTEISVIFSPSVRVVRTMVDVTLPTKIGPVKGFRVQQRDGDSVKVKMPNWMDRWKDDHYSWHTLCKLIVNAYTEQYPREIALPDEMEEAREPDAADERVTPEQSEISEISVGETTGETAQPQSGEKKAGSTKEKSELGRVLNAENNPFMFYPRTVLRLVESDQQKKKFHELVAALNKGSLGGIGPFEINLLMWVEKLRYVTKAMLLKLIENNYISVGWRANVTANKLTTILNRMRSYDLIDLTRFVTVDDNGEPDNSGISIVRIITIGKTGNTLLHELGKNTRAYNPFDIMQDGNTVKRYLSANQWLIYWLTTYRDQVNDNYDSARVIYQKGSEYSGARIYGTVTLDGETLVAESIRRGETFETESLRNQTRSKIQRMTSMFDNLDQLYVAREPASFPVRPVMVLICEDDEHIAQVRDMISDIMEENPEQIFWFTTDLRVFNKNMKNQRFLCYEDGEAKIVDEGSYFHLS